eukprot:5703360-Amphidinium_carterae.2
MNEIRKQLQDPANRPVCRAHDTSVLEGLPTPGEGLPCSALARKSSKRDHGRRSLWEALWRLEFNVESCAAFLQLASQNFRPGYAQSSRDAVCL